MWGKGGAHPHRDQQITILHPASAHANAMTIQGVLGGRSAARARIKLGQPRAARSIPTYIDAEIGDNAAKSEWVGWPSNDPDVMFANGEPVSAMVTPEADAEPGLDRASAASKWPARHGRRAVPPRQSAPATLGFRPRSDASAHSRWRP
jgi:hypothetical protein